MRLAGAAMSAALAPLIYNGEVITQRDAMLSLTDMWKAAGSDPAKAPAQWQRLAQAEEFIDHVSVIVGIPHNKLIEARRRGGTFAHWQIAMAYAKYLSPEFHMWCNTVVRERMEGRVDTSLPPPRRTSALELRRQHSYWSGVAASFGLDPNQALISTNRIVRKVTGVDVMAEMGVAALPSPTSEALLIPSEIGARLGGVSPKVVNTMLIEVGFQTSYRTHSGRLEYELTEAGKAAGGKKLDSERRHANGTMVHQIKWQSSVVEKLRQHMQRGAAA